MGIVWRRILVSYLVLWIIAIGMLPTNGWALLIPSDVQYSDASQRDTDLLQVQRHLEGKLVTQRLAELGLTTEEVQARLAGLTNEQLHQLAGNLDGLQVGGDLGLTFVLIFVGAVLLAILFIYAVRPLFVDRHASAPAPVVVEPGHTVPEHHH
jgi:uncharacterized protein DUF6627